MTDDEMTDDLQTDDLRTNDRRAITALLAENEIRSVLMRYCRGIDRRQLDLVRSCYHPDATDEHGDFAGTVDQFLAHCSASLDDFECTVHFVGNVLIEIDELQHDRARCETYVVASHRVPPRNGRPRRDHVVGLRYIDDFECRDGRWLIAHRVCAFDWTRTDPVGDGWDFTDGFRRGRADRNDIVFAPSLRPDRRERTA